MDVGAWLEALGLSKYKGAFHENAIDLAVLPKLTVDDLRDLGVTAIGDRRKLLDAIAALAYAPASNTDAMPLTTDRRQLTVMFVDLVGSTALAARLDPEDMRAIIGNYHKTVAAAVSAAGGFVAKYMGDGVLAYFGYPRAQENDAERAVDAGLRIADAAQSLRDTAGDRLHVRVGVATGVVVVGDLIGSGEASERGVVGDTPNLAARLQSVAEPDQIVIAEGTRRLIGDLFDLHDLGALELKGIAGHPRAFAVISVRAVESRFEALRGGALSDFVGREEERDLLARRWAKAKAGQGHVVLISGEPGIGKSRLTEELLARISAEPHTRMRYFCSPQSVDSALFPIIGHMERAAGFSREDNAKVKLDKLDMLLTRTATTPEDRGLIADMLGLADDGRYPPLEPQAAVRRQNLLSVLTAQIERLSRETPVLVLFEDAHWADASSLEAMGRLFDRIANLKGLAVVTFRPEFAPPWAGLSHVTALTLNRLTREEIDTLVVRLSSGNPLPDSLRHDIVERADGVPLFAEEIAKGAIEAGEAAARLVSSLPSPDRAVPASLHASLLARLDRLGSAKEVAQAGAAIGRSFSFDLLEAVTGKPAAELGLALQKLGDAGLLFRQGASPQGEYQFKHALIQDAAYGALLREPRRALHARIVEALETLTPDIATTRPETLAQHSVDAGDIERGARLWGQAGKLACVKSATVEGEAMLRRALALIEGLQSTPEVRRHEIEFQIAMMNALFVTRGWSSSPAKEASERAQLLMEKATSLGDTLENPLALFAILYGIYIHFRVNFDGAQILDLGGEFLSLAERSKNYAAIAYGRTLLGAAQAETGEIETGRAMLQRSIQELRGVDRHVFINNFNLDILSYIHIPLAYASYVAGFQDTCEKEICFAVDAAREIKHLTTLLPNISCCPPMHILLGKTDRLLVELNEMSELSQKLKIEQFVYRDGIKGFAALANGNIGVGCSLLRAAQMARVASGSTMAASFYWVFLAETYLSAEMHEDARFCLHAGFEHIEQKRERWFEADAYRVAGEIARAERDETEAEACFERALAVARSQKARSLELRAATSFARMRRDQGRREEARDMLQNIYDWFTEGFEKPDLKAARELLDQLG